MSLEQAVKENTAAVLELVSLLKQNGTVLQHPVVTMQSHEKVVTKPEPKPESKVKKDEPKKEEPKKEEPKKEEPKKEEPKVEEITFESLVPDYLKVVKKRGREFAVKLLAKYGVVKLSEVPAESLDDVAADIAAALED